MATILPSNFTSNSLSGSFTVENGLANVTLRTVPYALEGDKSFVIKIRRNSILGDVIATSPPIVLRDTSSVVSLTANVASVQEGDIVRFTLTTANAVDNSNVYFSVLPQTANVTSGDFIGANTGITTIANNQAIFSLYANTDAGYVNEDGETFKVQLRTNSVTGNIVYATANVQIIDRYKLVTISNVTANTSSTFHGSNIVFTVSAFNGNNITLFYSTSGNVNSTNFIGGNTGSFVANTTGGVVVLQSNTNVPLNEVRQFSLQVFQTGYAATSSSNVVITGPISYIEATGGTVITTGGYRTHVFTSSANLDVSSLGASNNIEYLIVAGGGGGGGGGTPGGPAGYGGGGGAGAGGTFIANATVGLGGTVIVVGGGGAATSPKVRAGFNGSNTTIALFGGSTILAYGGGGGSGAPTPSPAVPGAASPGGSGGGTAPNAVAGAGSGTPGQGYPGTSGIMSGSPVGNAGGGGGGAAEAGVSADGPNNMHPSSVTRGGDGIGVPWVPGSYGTPGPTPGARYFGGGGGGGNSPVAGGYNVRGGYGGGGAGGAYYSPPSGAYAIGRNTGGRDGGGYADGNTGGGGGGNAAAGAASGTGQGGPGGSGIVIIRYPYI